MDFRRDAAFPFSLYQLARTLPSAAPLSGYSEEHLPGEFAASADPTPHRPAACAGRARFLTDRAEPVFGLDRLLRRFGVDRQPPASGPDGTDRILREQRCDRGD